jgi:hypothetical protein
MGATGSAARQWKFRGARRCTLPLDNGQSGARSHSGFKVLQIRQCVCRRKSQTVSIGRQFVTRSNEALTAAFRASSQGRWALWNPVGYHG